MWIICSLWDQRKCRSCSRQSELGLEQHYRPIPIRGISFLTLTFDPQSLTPDPSSSLARGWSNEGITYESPSLIRSFITDSSTLVVHYTKHNPAFNRFRFVTDSWRYVYQVIRCRGERPLDVDGLNHRAASRCIAIKERVRACSWIQEKVQRQIHSSRTKFSDG